MLSIDPDTDVHLLLSCEVLNASIGMRSHIHSFGTQQHAARKRKIALRSVALYCDTLLAMH
jgi:hypothetical protein